MNDIGKSYPVKDVLEAFVGVDLVVPKISVSALCSFRFALSDHLPQR